VLVTILFVGLTGNWESDFNSYQLNERGSGSGGSRYARNFQQMLNRLQQLKKELNQLKLKSLQQEIQKGIDCYAAIASC
jgi:hypothetical protein